MASANEVMIYMCTSCYAADVMSKLMKLYQLACELEKLDSVVTACDGRMFLQTLCAGGNEAAVVTTSMHVLLEAEEVKLLLSTASQQQHGDPGNLGHAAAQVAVEDLQVNLSVNRLATALITCHTT